MILFWTAVSLFKSNYFILLSIGFASMDPQQENQIKGKRNGKNASDRLWGVRGTASISNSAETISFRVNESMIWDCKSGPSVVL